MTIEPAQPRSEPHDSPSAHLAQRWRRIAHLGLPIRFFHEQIAATVGRSRQFVDEWVKRYRCGGIQSLCPRKQPGARPKLTQDQQQQLKAMLDAGPLPEEGLAAYNGPILREKIQQHFGKLCRFGP